MKLKQICLVFAAALILSLAVCSAAFAETSGDFTYAVNSDGASVTITGYSGRDKALVIPPEIDGYIVTDLKISNGNSNITSISVPDSVTNITQSSIMVLTNLAEITVSSANETYSSADGILFDKDMTRLIACPRKKSADSYAAPGSLKTIGAQAFANTSGIKAITLPEGLTAIEDRAFESCPAVVNIPSSVTEIGMGALGRKKFSEIILSSDNKDFVISDKALYSADMTRLLLYSDEKTDAELKLPETVASIDNYAFYNNKNLISAIVPDSVTEIGNYAFMSCSGLLSAKLPDALTVIPTGIYQGCRKLRRFEVGENVKEIKNSAFYGSYNLAISIPESVTEIGRNAIITTSSGTTTIYGAAGSYAETYANQNGIPFADISTMPTPEPLPTAAPTSKPTTAPTPAPEPTETPTAKPTLAPVPPVPTATSDPMEFRISNFAGDRCYVRIGSGYPNGVLNFTAIAAKYSGDVLSDIMIKNSEINIIGSGTKTATVNFDRTMELDNNNESIKIMILDDLENCKPLCESYVTALVEAFPGAEGGGKYSVGARGDSNIEVYHVTNLNDSGSGSLRDAVSKPGRIVVFDVGGTINLESSIRNITGVTILGQTAPGDGITVTGANLELGGSDIVRYLRIRPTFVNKIEADALGGYASSTIIDHCSVSYSIDEALSVYNCSDTTVQNCIDSESLKNGGHSKGAHGYGGIWGGTNASFHHNLLASHDSRNPRIAAGPFEGNFDYDMSKQTSLTDLRNNIIYNWGGNSAYGGQGAMAANIINSYYKPGPSTTSHRSRIFQTTSTGNGQTSKWATDLYVDGNYMEGNQSITADNSKGVDHDSTVAQYYVWTKDNITDEAKAVHFKYENDYPVTTQTAEETYNTLLDHVGASLPRRDETDARIISEVRNGQGRIIDNEAEVGGVMQYEAVYRPFEIPREWKNESGMGGAYEGDIVPSGRWMGYTWIEAYVNEWTEQQENPTNPDVTIQASANGNNIAVSAEASPVGDSSITKIVIYDGDKIISEHETDKVNVNIDTAVGTHYISALAYNQKGESTRSTISVVEVK